MNINPPNIPNWDSTSTFRLGPYTTNLPPPVFETESVKPFVSTQTLSAEKKSTAVDRKDSMKPITPIDIVERAEKSKVKDGDVDVPLEVSF
ncbi:hypothetical protein EG328_009529 [Venturia inaequalis]|uniref:Uncharacterized protein n=1 Tax=Venturia inaequalis TaxID=5025 RepID=A0A8H3V760_VENIN|nr:hypothetical protein EG328_009529 [Venturia inaequalis]